MYISHKHKFVFLRVPKTASSSLSEFFIRNLNDPDAIHTPVDDTNIKEKNLPKGLMQKYKDDFGYFHLTLQQIYEEGILTEEQIREYRIVAIMREPIDRHLSFYHFYRKWEGRGQPSSNELERMSKDGYFHKHKNSKILQSDFLKLQGEVVGEYLPYDDFEAKVMNIMSDLGVDVKHQLPKHKSGFRKTSDNGLMSDKVLSAIKQHFKEDFDLYEAIHETN